MDEARLEALLEEATAHCYDEEDRFWGVFTALMGRVSYPLQGEVGGEAVILIGVDGSASSPETGIMARIQKEGAEETVPLAQVEPVDPDPESAGWLAMYRHWLSKRG